VVSILPFDLGRIAGERLPGWQLLCSVLPAASEERQGNRAGPSAHRGNWKRSARSVIAADWQAGDDCWARTQTVLGRLGGRSIPDGNREGEL
jgi:hypothetical protein